MNFNFKFKINCVDYDKNQLTVYYYKCHFYSIQTRLDNVICKSLKNFILQSLYKYVFLLLFDLIAYSCCGFNKRETNVFLLMCEIEKEEILEKKEKRNISFTEINTRFD